MKFSDDDFTELDDDEIPEDIRRQLGETAQRSPVMEAAFRKMLSKLVKIIHAEVAGVILGQLVDFANQDNPKPITIDPLRKDELKTIATNFDIQMRHLVGSEMTEGSHASTIQLVETLAKCAAIHVMRHIVEAGIEEVRGMGDCITDIGENLGNACMVVRVPRPDPKDMH